MAKDVHNGPGIGKGKTNLSGRRGISPVLQVRVTPELLERVENMAQAADLSVSVWLRRLLDRARK